MFEVAKQNKNSTTILNNNKKTSTNWLYIYIINNTINRNKTKNNGYLLLSLFISQVFFCCCAQIGRFSSFGFHAALTHNFVLVGPRNIKFKKLIINCEYLVLIIFFCLPSFHFIFVIGS